MTPDEWLRAKHHTDAEKIADLPDVETARDFAESRGPKSDHPLSPEDAASLARVRARLAKDLQQFQRKKR